MHVGIWFILGSECISIILTHSWPSVEFVIEPLPLLTSASIVAKFVRLVQVLQILTHLVELDKVVANGAIYFATVNQEEELRLNSGIKVEFKLGCRICVHANVVVIRIGSAKLFVVFLDLGTHWIPTSSEVDRREGWPLLIQMLHHFFNTIAWLGAIWD